MYYFLEQTLKVYAVFFFLHIIAHWMTLKQLCMDVIKRQESPQVAAQRFSQELASFLFVAVISSIDSMIVAAQLAIHVLNQGVDWLKIQTNYSTLVDNTCKETQQPVFPPIDPRKEN